MFCWGFASVSFCGSGFVWLGFFSEIKGKSPLNYLIKFLMANPVPILAGQKKSFLPPFVLLLSIEQTEKSLSCL